MNYSGERVEQSSSLLYTLALALLAGVSRWPIPEVGYWLGIAAGIVSLFRAQTLCERLGWSRPPWLPALIGTLPIFLYWWFGGLETTLVAWLGVELALVGAGLVDGRLRVRSPRVLAVTAGWLLVRPEAVFVLASAGLAWLLLERLLRARAQGDTAPTAPAAMRRWLILALAVSAASLAFRVAYFGQAFPQPVVAKLGGSALDRISLGAAYTAKYALWRPYAVSFFAALAATGVLLARVCWRGAADARLFLLLLVAASAAAVVTSGGDWMRGARFFAQLAPLALVAGAGALQLLQRRRRLVAMLLAAAFVANTGGIVALAFRESSGRPLWLFLERDRALRAHAPLALHWSERANRFRTRDFLFLRSFLPLLDRILEEQDDVTILSRQAGMVMYYVAQRHFGRIRFVDLHGLASREATRLSSELGGRYGPTGIRASPALLVDVLERHGSPTARPDVVFDVMRTSASLQERGYVVVHEQVGGARGPELTLGRFGEPGVHFSVYQYAAVAPRLAPLFPLPTRFHWDRRRRELDHNTTAWNPRREGRGARSPAP